MPTVVVRGTNCQRGLHIFTSQICFLKIQARTTSRQSECPHADAIAQAEKQQRQIRLGTKSIFSRLFPQMPSARCFLKLRARQAGIFIPPPRHSWVSLLPSQGVLVLVVIFGDCKHQWMIFCAKTFLCSEMCMLKIHYFQSNRTDLSMFVYASVSGHIWLIYGALHPPQNKWSMDRILL